MVDNLQINVQEERMGKCRRGRRENTKNNDKKMRKFGVCTYLFSSCRAVGVTHEVLADREGLF